MSHNFSSMNTSTYSMPRTRRPRKAPPQPSVPRYDKRLGDYFRDKHCINMQGGHRNILLIEDILQGCEGRNFLFALTNLVTYAFPHAPLPHEGFPSLALSFQGLGVPAEGPTLLTSLQPFEEFFNSEKAIAILEAQLAYGATISFNTHTPVVHAKPFSRAVPSMAKERWRVQSSLSITIGVQDHKVRISQLLTPVMFNKLFEYLVFRIEEHVGTDTDVSPRSKYATKVRVPTHPDVNMRGFDIRKFSFTYAGPENLGGLTF